MPEGTIPIRHTRRGFLAALLTGATAGCVRNLDPSDPIPTRFDNPSYAGSYSSSGTWGQFGYDATRSSFTRSSALPRSEVGGAWLRTIANGVHGTTAPVIDDERLYVGHETSVVAYDPKTGAQKWNTPITTHYVHESALIGEYIVIGTAPEERDTVYLRAFRRDTGDEAWTQSFPELLTGAPAVIDQTILVATRDDDATVYAFDTEGTMKWETPLSKVPYTPVSADTNGVFVTAADGSIVALDLADGAKRWSKTIAPSNEGGDAPPIQGTPAIDAENIYAPGIDARLYAVDRTDGSEAWTSPLLEDDYGNALPSPAVSDSTVYASTAHGGLIALDASNGHERWRAEHGGLEPPVATEDGVIGVGGNILHAYTPAGQQLWTFEMKRGDAPGDAGYIMDPSVAASHGMVYVTLSDSRVYGIGGS